MAGAPRVVDLFCGAGGLSLGFRQAGFHVVAGQDMNVTAGRTFSLSHGGARFVGGPIQAVEPADLGGDIDVLVGGPPCQGYSYYNHGRGSNDPRAGLFREYLRIVAGLQPGWLVMENVAGITSIGDGAVIREIRHAMDTLGYRMEVQLLRSEFWGIPQERRRMIFIATRTERAIRFPSPTHGPDTSNPFVTIGDAISDLPLLANGGGEPVMRYIGPPRTAYQSAMRSGCAADRLTGHQAPRLSALNLTRLSHIPQGGSWRDIPHHLLPEGMKRARRSDHTKRYGRPRWTDLSCTILTKCDVHWGAFFHPEQPRAFSLREAARLQSFPDDFEFQGSRTEGFTQVGNAVPPLLGAAIARSILTTL